MKHNYRIIKLDRRYRYHDWFEYAISWPGRMVFSHGPLQFAQAQQWFFDTYGWSAEIRQYEDIRAYIDDANRFLRPALPMPAVINPHWSWTNGINNECRVYLATEKELTFFMMSHPRETP